MRTALSWILFPVTFIGIISGALFALGQGVSASVVTGIGTLTGLLIAATLERIHPFRPEWNHSKGDLATDAIYFPTYIAINSLVEPAIRVAAVATGAALSQAVSLDFWPQDWSLVGQLALACVVVEAFDYWPHRALHEVPALWRFHAIHHNSKRLYWLNATRAHPVEVVFRGVINVIPLALLGAGESLLVLVALTNAVLGFFQHANVDFKLGPLSWIFSVGEMHRWHHSVELREANNNYGSNFLFWDILFGTRYRERERLCPEAIGIRNDTLPTAWWRQLGAPFRNES